MASWPAPGARVACRHRNVAVVKNDAGSYRHGVGKGGSRLECKIIIRFTEDSCSASVVPDPVNTSIRAGRYRMGCVDGWLDVVRGESKSHRIEIRK